mgnify:FL=1
MKFVCQQGTVLGGSPIPKGYLRFGDREGPNPQTVGALVCGKDPRDLHTRSHKILEDFLNSLIKAGPHVFLNFRCQRALQVTQSVEEAHPNT